MFPPTLFLSLRFSHSFGGRDPLRFGGRCSLPAPAAGPLLPLLVFFLLFRNGATAQHYLPNGDFTNLNVCCEYHISCAPMGWWTSSSSTFNFKPVEYTKNKEPIPVPAMIKMLGEIGLNERSYIQAPLLCPLVKGETYELTISYSQNSWRFNSLDVYFSDSFIHIPAKKVFWIDSLTGYFRTHQYDSLIDFLPQNEFALKTGTFARGVYTQTITYTASGTEKFLLLGNFKSDENTSYQKNLFGKKTPVHYISIHKIALSSSSGLNCDCEKQEEILETLNRRHSYFGACNDSTLRDMNALFENVDIWKLSAIAATPPLEKPHLNIGKGYRIEGLYFAFDSAVLEERSYPALDSLVEILRFYSEYSVTIEGHTDSLGNAAYNELLSLNRAEAVMDYLISKGVDAKKLKAVGYGSTQPVASNHTDEGRQLNRRVEFIIRSPFEE